MVGVGRWVSWTLASLWGLWTGVLTAAACLYERRKRSAPRIRGDQRQEAVAADRRGHLTSVPGCPTAIGATGLRRLGRCFPCDGFVYVPASYRPDHPAPLLLMLHGAGGVGLFALWPILRFAGAAGLIVLAPDSRGRTWDRVLGAFGPDVAFIDQVLAGVFSRYAVDPTRLAIGGFSDGASYALSLGLTNGNLFSDVLAFSPGFMAPAREEGRPRIFVSHGTEDRVLPLSCSLRIVSRLRQDGYDVVFQQFVGAHTVPSRVADEAINWFTGTNDHRRSHPTA